MNHSLCATSGVRQKNTRELVRRGGQCAIYEMLGYAGGGLSLGLALTRRPAVRAVSSDGHGPWRVSMAGVDASEKKLNSQKPK